MKKVNAKKRVPVGSQYGKYSLRGDKNNFNIIDDETGLAVVNYADGCLTIEGECKAGLGCFLLADFLAIGSSGMAAMVLDMINKTAYLPLSVAMKSDGSEVTPATVPIFQEQKWADTSNEVNDKAEFVPFSYDFTMPGNQCVYKTKFYPEKRIKNVIFEIVNRDFDKAIVRFDMGDTGKDEAAEMQFQFPVIVRAGTNLRVSYIDASTGNPIMVRPSKTGVPFESIYLRNYKNEEIMTLGMFKTEPKEFYIVNGSGGVLYGSKDGGQNLICDDDAGDTQVGNVVSENMLIGTRHKVTVLGEPKYITVGTKNDTVLNDSGFNISSKIPAGSMPISATVHFGKTTSVRGVINGVKCHAADFVPVQEGSSMEFQAMAAYRSAGGDFSISIEYENEQSPRAVMGDAETKKPYCTFKYADVVQSDIGLAINDVAVITDETFAPENVPYFLKTTDKPMTLPDADGKYFIDVNIKNEDKVFGYMKLRIRRKEKNQIIATFPNGRGCSFNVQFDNGSLSHNISMVKPDGDILHLSLAAERVYSAEDLITLRFDYVKGKYAKIWIDDETIFFDISETAEIEAHRGLTLDWIAYIGSPWESNQAGLITDYFVETTAGTLIDGRSLTSGALLCLKDEFGRIVSTGNLAPESKDFKTAFTRRGHYHYRMFNPTRSLPPRYKAGDCDFDCDVFVADDNFIKIIATDVRSNAIWELSKVGGVWHEWVAAGQMSTELFQVHNESEATITDCFLTDVNSDERYHINGKMFTALPAGRRYILNLVNSINTITGMGFVASGGNVRTLVVQNVEDVERGLRYDCTNDVVGAHIIDRDIHFDDKKREEFDRRFASIEDRLTALETNKTPTFDLVNSPCVMFAPTARLIFSNNAFNYEKQQAGVWQNVGKIQ